MSGHQPPFRPIEYNCPICGERTTFGTHFCKGEGAKARKRRPALPALPFRRIGSIVIAIVLIEILLGGLIGMYSLYLQAALFLVVLAALGIRHSPLARVRAEYLELVKLAGDDRERVERLIAREEMRRSEKSRREHVRELIEDFRRDKSR